MSQISNFLENELLDAVFNAASYTPVGLYASLHTADPGETGASEVTGGSYARQDVSASFAAPSAGSVTTDAAINFTDMPATTVTHVGGLGRRHRRKLPVGGNARRVQDNQLG